MAAGAECEVVMAETNRVRNAGSLASSTFGREYYFTYFYAYAEASGTPLHARRNAPGKGWRFL